MSLKDALRKYGWFEIYGSLDQIQAMVAELGDSAKVMFWQNHQNVLIFQEEMSDDRRALFNKQKQKYDRVQENRAGLLGLFSKDPNEVDRSKKVLKDNMGVTTMD